MPDGGETVTVKLLASLDEVSAADWDACAGPLAQRTRVRCLELAKETFDSPTFR